MTIEEKIERVSKVTDKQLLDYFIDLATNYNPVDFDKCETYDLVKLTILERMRKRKKRKKNGKNNND